MKPIGVVGSGSWGTALAVQLAGQGHSVLLWSRRRDFAEQLAAERTNEAYLPGIPLPESLRTVHRLEDLAACEVVLMVVPSHGFREVLQDFLAVHPKESPLALVSATKGVEIESGARMSEVWSDEAARAGRAGDRGFAVLAGPTFAMDLAKGYPSLAVLASDDEGELATELQGRLSGGNLRLYSSSDVVGLELGGTSKNVIAIAAGIVVGLELGHNTLAALITRGLHELTRLGLAYGGKAETFSGLGGLGDLVLTCTGGLSRNRKTGLLLAEGKTLEEITRGTNMVAEGIRNARSISNLARQKGVEMPITEQMVAVLYEGKEPKAALADLMSRRLRPEAAH